MYTTPALTMRDATFTDWSDLTDALDLTAEQSQVVAYEIGRRYTWGNPDGLTLVPVRDVLRVVCAMLEQEIGTQEATDRLAAAYALLGECDWLNMED